MIIDSHCHASERWYEPVEILIQQMERNGVGAAVLVQMLGSFDAGYMVEAAARFEGRFAIVGSVRVEAEDACARLGAVADTLDGIRLRPSSRSPGPDPLAIWRCAGDLGLPVSCVGTAADFADPAFARLIEQLPQLVIVLEHFGGLARPDVGDRDAIAGSILALGAHPNLHLKLTGLGQLAPRLPDLDDAADIPLDLGSAPALIEDVIAAFGPERIMWGSDFPPVAAREGYANALAWPRAKLSHHSQAAIEAIFGGTARRIFFSGR